MKTRTMKDVKWEDLTAFEKAMVRRIQVFCNSCHQEGKSGIISAEKLTIKLDKDLLRFYCLNEEHRCGFRWHDMLFSISRAQKRLPLFRR